MKTYNPKKVVVTLDGVPVEGFVPGTFINIEPNDSDGFKKQVGADGEVGRAQSNDNTHKVTITLMQTSASNAHFSSVRKTDKLTGTSVHPLSITDLNGESLHYWPEAWILGDPTWSYGNELTERQWTLDTGQIADGEMTGITPIQGG